MASNSPMVAIPGSTRKVLPGANLISKSDPAQSITISVYLRRNPSPSAEALSTIKAMSAQLPGQRRAVTDSEFNSVYGADPAELERVAKWAQENNLEVVDSSLPKRRLLLKGTIADVEHAFDTQLNEYDHPEHGRFRGRVGRLQVAGDMAGIVEGVFGLDTRRVGNPRLRKIYGKTVDWETLQKTAHANGKGDTQRAALRNKWPGTFFPPQVSELYDYPTQFDGTGENIAIFAFNGPPSPDPRGGYNLAALSTYFEKVLGGKTPTITDVVVQGAGNDPGPDTQTSSRRGDSTGEVMLDMCVIGSVAPGANIFMYFTEFNSQGWIEALSAAITDNNAISVISISYGNPEDDPQGLWTSMGVSQVNQACEAAIAKQITICVASGDDGSDDGVGSGAHVDFPASSPNVLAVGGTTLTATQTSPTTIANEVVWNEVFQGDGATGGGISSVFSKPSYQERVHVPVSVNRGHNVGRGVPDVAAIGDPVTGVVVMHVNGRKLEPIGGTSASTPMWAALIARVNQGLNARCGFLNQILYTELATGVLNDITSGNNGAYSASVGWDACSGLGSPQGQRLLHALSSSA